MRNIAAWVMFVGSRFHGWQVQRDVVTVAGTLEAALSRLCGHVVKVHGCGRTDAGVHAERYCFNFFTSSSIPPERFPFALNPLLPPDISLVRAVFAPDDFDSNMSCIKKEYSYRIFVSRFRDPFFFGRVLFYPLQLDVDAMRLAASHFVGTRDFAALRSVGSVTRSSVRTVFWFEVDVSGSFVVLRVCADGFLYNMARAMVGTLIYVSEGKICPFELPRLLDNGVRCFLGPTVPPDGLFLSRVWYDGVVGEMMGM